ncbi:hypothetical protein BC941DRAFT_451309 [Chlamydoabsidia padenii]|nr:hypothetical protein BC941DRAFT_451309 [Chlamydoabsidia padenii]
MEVFVLLQQVQSKKSANDLQQIRTLLTDPSLFHDQVLQQQLESYLQQDEFGGCPHAPYSLLKSILAKAANHPNYISTVTEVAHHYELLHQVQTHLLDSFGFNLFIKDCFENDDQQVTSDTIADSIDKVKARMEPQQKEILDRILQQHPLHNGEQQMNTILQDISAPTQDQFEPGMDRLMQEAYDLLNNDPVLCQQFAGILNSDQINGIPFTDTWRNMYQWVLSVNPTLWNQMATVLSDIQILLESTLYEYESYEDFVQKNFLDDGGQEYLDNEIEQARLQHMFNQFSI